MNTIRFYFTIAILCFTGPTALSQVQCAIDVQIVEGTTIEMCQNALVPLNATGGFVNYAWTGPQTSASQTITPASSGQFVVFATDAVNCVSSDTIQVTVFPQPVDAISSSNGDTICGTGSSVLSLANSYSLYNWTGGVSTPTLTVTETGTYTVDVTDANNCVGSFSYKISQIEFSVANVGSNACVNTAILQASGGESYLWSTGETSNTIVVSSDVETIYDVTITSGSCIDNLSITVPVLAEPIQFSLPDTFYVAANEYLAISGPDGFSSYSWSPGDQFSDSTVQVVSFVGTETQTCSLAAIHPGGCAILEPFVVVVVDLTIPSGFSPNHDMINDLFVIPEIDQYVGKLVVWNRWGDVVYESEHYENSWAGTCETGFCFNRGSSVPEGTYFYQVDVGGITKEGYVTISR